jgi:hypothetical protein
VKKTGACRAAQENFVLGFAGLPTVAWLRHVYLPAVGTQNMVIPVTEPSYVSASDRCP